MMKLLVAFAFLLLSYSTDQFLARRSILPERPTFESFPMSFGAWQCPARELVNPEVLGQLGATDYLICTYDHPDGRRVNLYLGYHASQVYEDGTGFGGENSIHPPSHCLPGAGWDIIDSRSVVLDIPGLPDEDARVKRLVVARGEARQLVYYWYQTQGRVLAEDWQKILFVGYDRATRGRTDGSLVRFTMALGGDFNEQRADESFREFARLALPQVRTYLPE
jgi:EpsI family protein